MLSANIIAYGTTNIDVACSKVWTPEEVSDLNQLIRPEACQQLALGNVSWYQFRSITSTLSL